MHRGREACIRKQKLDPIRRRAHNLFDIHQYLYSTMPLLERKVSHNGHILPWLWDTAKICRSFAAPAHFDFKMRVLSRKMLNQSAAVKENSTGRIEFPELDANKDGMFYAILDSRWTCDSTIDKENIDTLLPWFLLSHDEPGSRTEERRRRA